MSTALWTPSKEYIENSEIYKFKNYIESKYTLYFEDYDSFHQWSIDYIELFWESILNYFGIIYSGEFTEVLSWNKLEKDFISAKWFEGVKLSYAEHIFESYTDDRPALKFISEYEDYQEVSWFELQSRVSKIQQFLLKNNIKKGDRIVGVLNNRIDTIAIFLAVNSLGAIWSCCSPDFGDKAIIDRFGQIEPKLLFVESEYQYNNKIHSKSESILMWKSMLTSLELVVDVKDEMWNTALSSIDYKPLKFERVEFSHPIWILYSSGTTGKPKAITHSTGGNLLEHFKALALHQNLQQGENFLWYASTGWMMWNYALSSLLCGATLCIFDGIINHKRHYTFWNFLRMAQVDHLGAGAAYFASLGNFSSINYQPKVIASTGSPLSKQTFELLYDKFPDVHIISLSGGTDVCSAFLSGNALLPVYSGYLQSITLGVDLVSFNDNGLQVVDEEGELVIKNPLPSMPIYLWNDKSNHKYRESYYEKFESYWTHGDWITINNKGIIIHGRSDATLNKGGIRIGTAEVYNVVNEIDEIEDSLVTTINKKDDSCKIILFVKLLADVKLNESIKAKIKLNLRNQYSVRHVPNCIYQVSDIPCTLSGKKLEIPVKKIFTGISLENAISKDIMKNPSCLNDFIAIYDMIS